MKRSLSLGALLALLMAGPAAGQRIDIDPSRFYDFYDSSHEVTPQGTRVRTTNREAGGVEQCVNIPGRIRDFGAVITVPRSNSTGSNEGIAAVAIIPYTGADCSGQELEPVPGTPVLRTGTTPFDTATQIRCGGAIPPNTASVRYVVVLATLIRLFEILLTGPFILCDVQTTTGPDLQPIVTLADATLNHVMNANGQIEMQTNYTTLGHGGAVQRGHALQVKVDVVNHGPAPHEGFWSVRVTLPERYSAARGWPGCDDVRGGIHTDTRTIPVGGKVTVCQVFVIDQPGGFALRVFVRVGTAFDINPSNNEVTTHPIEIQSTRGEPDLMLEILKRATGRGR
jgi:hypothetical protein